MIRSRLKNVLNLHPSEENKETFRKQRNCCNSLKRKCKQKFYNDISDHAISNSKTFWSPIRPVFTDEVKTSSKIILIENKKIISKNNELADIFSDYFSNIYKEKDTEYRDNSKMFVTKSF